MQLAESEVYWPVCGTRSKRKRNDPESVQGSVLNNSTHLNKQKEQTFLKHSEERYRLEIQQSFSEGRITKKGHFLDVIALKAHLFIHLTNGKVLLSTVTLCWCCC